MQNPNKMNNYLNNSNTAHHHVVAENHHPHHIHWNHNMIIAPSGWSIQHQQYYMGINYATATSVGTNVPYGAIQNTTSSLQNLQQFLDQVPAASYHDEDFGTFHTNRIQISLVSSSTSSNASFDCSICYKSADACDRLVPTCCKRQDMCCDCLTHWIDSNRDRPSCAFCRGRITCLETTSSDVSQILSAKYSTA